MISGLETIKSKRIWFVENLSVWGSRQDLQLDFLVTEQVEATDSILFGSVAIGSSLQKVSFADLIDHRGNRLPDSINTPRVIPRTHGDTTVYLVGTETNNDFRIAADAGGAEPVVCDLMIIEMGN